ncbi:aspartyl/asparaginyl beta-hydroxylase domain-containing protein [Antrihabitans cavernicola]|uniref:aspartyl/asparaginyl beta-hydroxylase domain-containing protein n=1 Tax=Antrihabitans cavernicola TaxID=2495913 RepID=UPI0016594371|nr:aspartyl/asparaginyl beta-hydroxylase domain-containing protein [Spelaeibacter cavernicola]
MIEDSWKDAREEVESLLQSKSAIPSFVDISVEQARLSNDDKWKTFFFRAYGVDIEENLQRCPATAALVRRIPGCTTAFFSIMDPGTEIPPHRGPFRGVIRYHLGIRIPEPARCGLKVGGEHITWEEGKGVFFDDTYEHEAWNRSHSERVVLFIDIKRPLRWPFNFLNDFYLSVMQKSELVSAALVRQRQWNVDHQDD